MLIATCHHTARGSECDQRTAVVGVREVLSKFGHADMRLPTGEKRSFNLIDN